ncbi:phospho-sugar mutase [Aeromicrobium fastidiosum]|uniref:Phospho-sugar mutase n=1 Tax=Aeromicrobium fastidiosum TaxID=52699 RepID=A0A641AHE1_9ACTN|nr:phospho-sugar mutase [Aeromicrobium fastidiosum]KAA1372940.1 phospho-sugar mutase [Aeromicrobium fastidiosum]MBP2390904.1 phosphomannomutase [Aeromicrobium fastidiosum]
MTTDLIARAHDWLSQDPDPVTRDELQTLIDANDVDALQDRFAERLQFGTAGLRGALGAGPNRMNRVIVAQAAAGLAAYLLEHASGPDARPSVVVGYDARHNSDVFARDTAEIMEGAGVHAFLLPTHLPTPVLAFAIRHLGCSAGVMVTASHNPPQDNGYKVYLEDSSQIVPPADAEISDAIDAVGRVDEMPRSDDYETLGDDVARAYVDAVVALPGDGPREVVAVYTPMHGVGRDTLVDAVARAGFPPLHVVREQGDPDPDFPTVVFPNPEEPGAMDLALKLASEAGADVIVANDPDADRCAVGVREGESYRMLTGDQVGVLLADFLLRRGVEGTYGSSIVSSDLLGRQAAAFGQPWEQTLTGFKWLGKIPTLVFGYEEALGYSVAPDIARDKDGVSAIITVLEMAAELKADGRSLIDRLDDIYREHGLHGTSQLSVRVDDLTIISRAMDVLRTSPPTVLGGLDVTSVDDLAEGYHGLPPTDGIRLGLDGGARIIARPSGTEPKLKCYIEVVIPVSGSIESARATADEQIEGIKADLADALGI